MRLLVLLVLVIELVQPVITTPRMSTLAVKARMPFLLILGSDNCMVPPESKWNARGRLPERMAQATRKSIPL
jgi:hypothetical protein